MSVVVTTWDLSLRFCALYGHPLGKTGTTPLPHFMIGNTMISQSLASEEMLPLNRTF